MGRRWLVVRVLSALLILGGMAAGPAMLAGTAGARAGAEPDGSSRERASPLGETGELDDYELTVIEVTPDATDLVAAENQFNDPPADGNQFYIARVEVTYTGSDTGNPGIDLNLQAVGAGNTGYTTFGNSCGVIPDEGYGAGELFEGGTVEYNACWQIASDDADSLVMYVEPLFSFDADPVWFALSDGPADTDGAATPAGDSDDAADELDFSDAGTDRDDPIAVGETGRIDDYAVTVLSVTPLADDVVEDENQFNDPPAAGRQFFIARVEITYLGRDSGDPGFDLNFQAVGDGNTGYSTFENSCGVVPEDTFEAGEVFSGGSVEVNVCWEIAEEDADSLQMYVEPLFAFDADPVWFALDED